MMFDWQQHLDNLYPSGLHVTQVHRTRPEAMWNRFHTPRLVVAGNDGERPVITCNVYEFEKDVNFTIEALEDVAPGVRRVRTPAGEPDFLLSTNLDADVLRVLRRARAEWYAL